MKSMVACLVLLAGVFSSAVDSADVIVIVDVGLGDYIDRVSDDGRYIYHRNGYKYVNTPRICDLSTVRLHVTGDNLLIQDFDILFGNGDIQDIPTRDRFARNSYTNWKDLDGRRRFIEGFRVRARPDRDWNNARVTLQAVQHVGWGENLVNVGTALVRDFN